MATLTPVSRATNITELSSTFTACHVVATMIFLNRYTALWTSICSYSCGPSLIDFFLCLFARLSLMPWGLAAITHEIFTIRAQNFFFRFFQNYPLTTWLRAEFFIFRNTNLMIFHQSIELLECISI